ncbi:hypothetical protein [Nitratireductor indicus]|uniref:hypothetical protein n=1 Tax=Nitratireductor indicus TaxID=721133 RepID=UPI0028766F84|nr:hypothetical protein [Nitratireductor indicus]MDS1136715.1 hypothetical protein [Nitratireductor indicus]
MPYTLIDSRRLFRNRFEAYLASGNPTASGEFDGSPLTLRDLCEILKHDPEPFPPYYDRDLIRLCGPEAKMWLDKERSYGDVTRLMSKHATLWMEGRLHGAVGWVTSVLDQAEELNRGL